MTVLYPNLCYNEVCYKGTALYLRENVSAYGILLLIQAFRYFKECVMENNFSYFSTKHMLWVLKRTISIRWFF